MIDGKRPQCNVPLIWILLNFLSSSACFKRVKGISKWWENYFFLQRLGNRCRSSVRLADKKISQIPDGDYSKTSDTTNVWKKRIFSGFSFNRIPAWFKDILLRQRPTTKRETCCYLWEASSFSQDLKSVLRSVCFTAVAVVSIWNIWMQIEKRGKDEISIWNIWSWMKWEAQFRNP